MQLAYWYADVLDMQIIYSRQRDVTVTWCKQTWRLGSRTSTILVWTQWNQNKYGGWVNNLNPFSQDDQNKYGRRAHLLKLNLHIRHF